MPMPDCCEECKLYRNDDCTNPHVKMSGPLDAEVLFIGEAPGEEEDIKGKPFVGKSGKLLHSAIESSKAPYKYAITNVVKCRPPGNRKPYIKKEVKHCWGFLEEEIKSLPNLKVIVIIGNVALRAICGYEGILDKSGTQATSDKFPQYKIFILMHPAYILRNQTRIRDFTEHTARIGKLLTGDLTDYSKMGVYKTVKTKEDFMSLYHDIADKKLIFYDIETNTLNLHENTAIVKCIQICVKSGEAFTIPIEEPLYSEIGPMIKELFEDSSIKKVGHNVKFDNLGMEKILGIRVNGTAYDTEILQFLQNENTSLSLKMLAWRYTDLGGYENYFLKNVPVDQAEGDDLYQYGACDTDVTARVFNTISGNVINNPKLDNLNKKILMPILDTFRDMELRGIRIDTDKVISSRHECEKIIEDSRNKILNFYSVKKFEKDSGLEFNPNSDHHLREVLFKYERLRPKRYTKKTKQPSTDKKLLEYYSENKLCQTMLNHNAYVTFNSKTLQEILDYTIDGRIHANYRICDASSGRTSSKKPNLQNVPTGDNDKTRVRESFIPDKDYVLAQFDYNQHELRIMASLAQDTNLMIALQGDVHTATTSSVMGISPDKVTKEDRRNIGKCVNPSMLIQENGRLKKIINALEGNTIFDGISSGNKIEKYFCNGIKDQRLIVYPKGIILCSNDHLILTNNGMKKALEIVPGKDSIIFSSPSPRRLESYETYKFNPFWNDGARTATILLDEKWAYFAGIFLGDGNYMSDHSASIACGSGGKYELWKESIMESCKEVGLNPIRNKTNIYLGSRHVTRRLKEIGLGSKKGKVMEVPEWVLRNKSNMISFLAGIIDTDGYISDEGSGEIVTKDAIFASHIAVMLAYLNISYTVRAKYNNQYSKYYYRIYLRSGYKEVIEKCKCKWKNKKLGRIRDTTRIENLDNKYVQINVAYGRENMFDLCIKSSNHEYWCSNSIVHNSLNFGLIYGMTSRGLGMTLGIREQEADMYISKFFSQYYDVRKYMKNAEDFIKKNHYIETVNGRIRHLPIWEEDEHELHTIRQGINYLIQPVASDILLCALIGISKFVKKYKLKSFPVLQVHDCVVLNIHKDEYNILPEIARIMKTYYEPIMNFKVEGIDVDAEVGDNWGQMQKIKL